MLLAELAERVYVRGLMDQLAVIGAGTCGGEPAKKLWRTLADRLHSVENAAETPLQVTSEMPLSAEDFERMMKPDAD